MNELLQMEIKSFCTQSTLTPRESEIVLLLAEGVVRIKDIAEKLRLSPNTVNNHVNNVFAKTGTRSKSELLARILNMVGDGLTTGQGVSQQASVKTV
ncbi:MAG TPA: LuxR C-terminal-related transcriptional regulator [Bdellovibrionales bacterium]|nr:LuxR C-terminal-related transcriptional regulator [Bdellovibrionales bacterium]